VASFTRFRLNLAGTYQLQAIDGSITSPLSADIVVSQ
jgi:hypothetical protein